MGHQGASKDLFPTHLVLDEVRDPGRYLLMVPAPSISSDLPGTVLWDPDRDDDAQDHFSWDQALLPALLRHR